MAERRIVPEGQKRRWILGPGPVTEPPEEAIPLLKAARGRTCRWASAGTAAGRGLDQVHAEHLLWELVDAGLVTVGQRRDPRGDWESYQYRLTEEGERAVQDDTSLADIEAYLAQPDPPEHPVLQGVRVWLADNWRPEWLPVRLVLAIGEEIRAGRVPRKRLLSLCVGGHTKSVRLEDHRAPLEEALGFPLEEVVRFHGRAVYAWGPFSFRIGANLIDGRFSVPWLALTPETIASMEELRLEADRLLTVENLVPFEEEIRQGLPERTLAVWTGGFPSLLERDLLIRFVGAGIERVDHWGDLDVGGIRILEHLRRILPCPVHAFRMEPELLDRLPTQPLTPRDRAALGSMTDPLALAMLVRGVKAEQEGWFLGPARPTF